MSVFDGTTPLRIIKPGEMRQNGNPQGMSPSQNRIEMRSAPPMNQDEVGGHLQNSESSQLSNNPPRKSVFDGTTPLRIIKPQQLPSTPQNISQPRMSTGGVPPQDMNGGSSSSPQNEKGILDNMINLAKALPASLGSNVDLLGMLYNLAAKSQNFNTEQEMNTSPLSDRLSDQHKKDYLKTTEIPTVGSLEQKIEQGLGAEHTPAYEGIKFAASLAGPGGVAKALKNTAPRAAKGLGAIGSLKKTDLAAAGAAGATIEATKDKVGELGSLGLGLGAGLGTQFAKNIAHGISHPRQGTRNIMAKMSAKKFKNEIYEAAKDINVPLPLAAVTDSKMIKFLNENISKYPFFGERIHEAFKESSNAFQNSMNELLETVGPAHGLGNAEAKYGNLYQKASQALPENAVTNVKKITDKMDELKKQVKSLIYGPNTEKLLEIIGKLEKSTSIKSQFGDFSPPVPMDLLVGTKRELNSRWDIDNKGTRKLIKSLNNSVLDVIKDYGKINPEWYKIYDKAERAYEKYAKRLTIDEAFEGKLINPITEQVNYPSLIKTLTSGKKKKILQKAFGEESYKNVEKFIDVARSLHEGKQLVNPSGTASQIAVYQFLASVPMALVSAPTVVAGNVITLKGMHTASKLLVDKEFVELVSKFSKDPGKSVADNIEEFVKTKSGMSLQTLNHKINSLIHKPEEKPKTKKKPSNRRKVSTHYLQKVLNKRKEIL
jgi:hypothetical protein